jgi:uncharacterized membrane protein (Fun14 family)
MSFQEMIDSIKAWWQGLNFERSFGESSADAVTVAASFVSFFAVGFLFKKYLKFIFFCLLISFLIIKGLEYYRILDVDWQAFNTLIGLEPATTIGSLATNAFEWVKAHIIITVASTLGFLLGYKLG